MVCGFDLCTCVGERKEGGEGRRERERKREKEREREREREREKERGQFSFKHATEYYHHNSLD